MTQARGMGPLPRVVRDEAGERALAALLRRHDFPDAVVGEPDARVPLADMVALFEDAARLVGDPFLGLRVGRSMHVTDYGSYIRHAAAGRTLAGGIDRAVRGIRYYQGAGALRLSVSGDEASFTYRQYATSRDAGRQHADHVLPGVLGFVRGFLGESWRPHRYLVPYQRQELGAQLEISLGGEVAFGQDGVGVVFDRSMLANRVTPRSATEGATVRELRQLVRGSPPDSLRADVAHLVALRLLDGRSDLAGVAARLRLSPRALQRQLAFERTSYQRVLDRVRHDLACRLLLETRLCVAEMADRLGYADHPHLTRAFRRLAGCSPSEFRAASLSG